MYLYTNANHEFHRFLSSMLQCHRIAVDGMWFSCMHAQVSERSCLHEPAASLSFVQASWFWVNQWRTRSTRAVRAQQLQFMTSFARKNPSIELPLNARPLVFET